MIVSTANIYRVNKHRNYCHSTQKVTSIKDFCFIWRCTRLVPGALMQHRILQIIFFSPRAWCNIFSPSFACFFLSDLSMYRQRPKPELAKSPSETICSEQHNILVNFTTLIIHGLAFWYRPRGCKAGQAAACQGSVPSPHRAIVLPSISFL